MTEVQITLCGRLTVSWDGDQLGEALPGRQGRLIFAYLVLNRRRPVRRDELVEALWADEGLPSGGEALLAPPLSRLRKSLGSGRLEGRTELSLNLGQDPVIDWEQAQTSIETARGYEESGRYSEAFDLAADAERIMAGGLLPGLEASWIDDYRNELEGMRLQALELIARSGIHLGETEQTRGERSARIAVESAPFRESARAALIEALEAQGNIAEALRAYEELRVLLRDELGTFPSAEVSAIHERLLMAHEKRHQGPPSHSAGSSVEPKIDTPREIGKQIDPRITGTDPLGRELVLRQLEEELDLAVTGELRIALLAGEGGVGKTRVAAELAARRDDITVLYGRSEPGEVRPFRLWMGLLQSALRQAADIDLEAIVGGDGPTLSRLLPDLARRMDLPAPGPTTDLESDRQALFGAVMRMIGRQSSKRPMLIILDDLHWADRSTLRLLASLAGDNPPQGILAVGIYRDTELPTESHLPDTLSQLQRRLPTTRIQIPALDEDEVRGLIAGRLNEGLAAQIRDQTGGNPFFIEQLVRNLEESGETQPSAVPAEIREVITQRVSRLPEGGHELLARAALIGRDFNLDILQRTTSEDEDRIIELLDAATAAGLLDESDSTPGRYSFVHALVRSSLANSLSLTRRAAIHRRIGEAIEYRNQTRLGHQRDEDLPTLAWHFTQAGPAEADRAIHYATQAAIQAEGRLAYDEAVDFYAGAISSCRADEPADQGLLANLLISKADAEWRMGRLPEAVGTFVEATEAARESGVPELFARAANGSSWGSWETFDSVRQTPISLLTEALELLDPEHRSLRAETLANLGHLVYFNGESSEEAVAMISEALDLAEELDDSTLLKVFVSSHFYLLQSTSPEYRLDAANRAVSIAEESADREDVAEALALRSVMLINAGRGADAAADIARHNVLSATLPQVRNTNFSLQAVQCFIQGRWEEGRRLTERCLAGEHVPASARIAMVDAMNYMYLAHCGRLGEVLEVLELEAAVSADWQAWPAWETGLALGHLQAGNSERAQALRDQVYAMNLGPEMKMKLLGPVFCGVAAMLAFEMDDRQAAEKLTDLMEGMGELWTIFGPGGATFGPFSLLKGEMFLLQGRHREAATAFENAIVTCAAMYARPFLARARLGLAESLSALGDPDGKDRTIDLRGKGLADAEELGMTPLLGRYR